ncbi:hypothetical protein BVRB_5g122090 [Beta vulgaris subsp. vulgaris]|nr:hypothetical protein BVRB_5g122090 [Beta vulgaris subsp. vulgaris]
MHLRKNRRVLMKRRRSSMIRRRDENGIRSKVQTLKSLIPKRESDQGLDGLFRDTASYIMSLQMRVRVMQIMVDVLDTTQAHDE